MVKKSEISKSTLYLPRSNARLSTYFKHRAVAARTSGASGPPPVPGLLPQPTDLSAAKPKPAVKKDPKKVLKGVVVKKKPKTTTPKQDNTAKQSVLLEDKGVDDDAPRAKRRKTENS